MRSRIFNSSLNFNRLAVRNLLYYLAQIVFLLQVSVVITTCRAE